MPRDRTPLDLYYRAYNLQYADGKIGEACSLYKEIIRRFPDSNECAYASIQLEKVMSDEVSGKIKVGGRKAVVAAYLLILLLAASVVALGYLGYRRLESMQRNTSRAIIRIENAVETVREGSE